MLLFGTRMPSKSAIEQTIDRAAGAIMGMLIGDALSLGCHWIYDVGQLKAEYGWVNDYTKPKPGRYHYGCDKGDVSQTGQLLQLLLESVAEKGKYDEADFCSRWDGLLATLDGTRKGGRYTEKDMCDVWKNRVVLKKPWGKCASPRGDNTNSFVRAAALAARYHYDLGMLARVAYSNSALHYADEGVRGHSMSFAIIIGALISGMPYDAYLGSHLYDLARQSVIPFSHIGVNASREETEDEPLSEPDSLLWASYCIRAANDKATRIEPATAAPRMYGLACSYYMVLPGAYYLAGSYPNDFEKAVLTAVNSGGQNLARASLTGAIVGAINGVSGIPARYIDGLKDGRRWLDVALKIAQQGVEGGQ